jgi:hypothetical protein
MSDSQFCNLISWIRQVIVIHWVTASSSMTSVSWPRNQDVWNVSLGNDGDWAPFWQHEQGRRFPLEEVTKVCHSNLKEWKIRSKDKWLTLDSTFPTLTPCRSSPTRTLLPLIPLPRISEKVTILPRFLMAQMGSSPSCAPGGGPTEELLNPASFWLGWGSSPPPYTPCPISVLTRCVSAT